MNSIQKIADSLQSYTPVIQFGAVSGMWHVTFADWTDEVYTGKTILQALHAAQQGVQPTCATSRRKRVASKSKVMVGRTRG